MDLSLASDADLIRMVSEGDARALEVLYDRYSRVIHSFSLRIVGDPQVAEEVLQEVFFRAWRQGSKFQSTRGSLITWLLSITHNLAIDEVRKRNRRPQRIDTAEPELLLAMLQDESQDVEQEVWISTLRDSIKKALLDLPAAQRKVIEMAYFEGLTQREIAEQLEEPLGTVKTRMRLGILKLRERLGEQFGDLMPAIKVDVA